MCDTFLEKMQGTPTDLHEPEVLTVAEVAAALRFTPTTIYAKLERGEIRGVRTSPTARIRIPRSELERLLRPEAQLSAGPPFPADASARGRAESTATTQRGNGAG